MNQGEIQTVDGWAIMELMGHRRLGGYVKEVQVGGAPFFRIDIPGEPPATQLYSPASIYCLTPTTEAIARAVAARNVPEPMQAWELPRALRELPATVGGPPECCSCGEGFAAGDAMVLLPNGEGMHTRCWSEQNAPTRKDGNSEAPAARERGGL